MKIRFGVFLLLSLAHPAFAAETSFKAGAARVDITPPVAELPAPYKSIFSKIYVRALLLENGGTRAAIVIADVPNIQAGILADLSRRIAEQAKVPLENILLGSTHTHNSIRVDVDGMGLAIVGSQKFTDRVVAASLEAVKQAAAKLQPARAGFAFGNARLISGRNEWYPAQHRYIDGIDRSGTDAVDHSLGVFKFETLSGEPIAFMLNYGIEPVVEMPAVSEISGDVPGAASQYIEAQFADKAVAIFTIGAAATPSYRVMKAEPKFSAAEVARVHKITSAMGTILGEEALAVSKDIRFSSDLHIGAAKRVWQCPGKNTTPFNLPNQCAHTPDSKLPACNFKDTDTAPVDIAMWLLRIGDVALVQTDANVSPGLGEKLKRASPLVNTVVVALSFGPARFLVEDASYSLNTYEVTATRIKQGCAERTYLENALQLLERTR